jgi:rubredoxin
VAAPCAPWHCVRGPVRNSGITRPFNGIVRLHRKTVPTNHACPKCGHSIGWTQLRDKLQCPGCGTQLESTWSTVFFWTTLVLGFPLSIAAAFGTWPFIIALALSGGLAFVISAVGSTIKVLEKNDAT